MLGNCVLRLVDGLHDHIYNCTPIRAPRISQSTPAAKAELLTAHRKPAVIRRHPSIMSNLIDADAGTERFGGYEAELKLVQADLNQQLEQIKETTGEPRKAAISKAERAVEEAEELVRRSLDARSRPLPLTL